MLAQLGVEHELLQAGEAAERWPQGAEPYAETTCLFTNTPDENFVLDRAEGVTVARPARAMARSPRP